MKVKIRATGEGAVVDIIEPGQGSGVEDTLVTSIPVPSGKELNVNLPTATVIEQVEYGDVVDSPAPPAEGGAPDTPGGGEEGSPAGGEPPAGGEQGGGTPDQSPPTTSAVSEKPLYLVEGDTVPEGFEESGLETPDGKTLFHYGSDTPGQHSTGNVDGVSVYAEADDNEQPVQAAQPAAEQPPA